MAKTVKKRAKKAKKVKKILSPRTHRKVLTFNDAELAAITRFCEKYKITNQTKFFRETIIATILRKTEEDHPTLF